MKVFNICIAVLIKCKCWGLVFLMRGIRIGIRLVFCMVEYLDDDEIKIVIRDNKVFVKVRDDLEVL